jgi:hypothetical protein
MAFWLFFCLNPIITSLQNRILQTLQFTIFTNLQQIITTYNLTNLQLLNLNLTIFKRANENEFYNFYQNLQLKLKTTHYKRYAKQAFNSNNK